MLKFRPLTLEDKKEYDSYVKPNNCINSEASFSNNFIWQEAWNTEIATDGHALYVTMYSDIYRPLIFPPFLKDMDESIQPYMEKSEEYMIGRFGDFYMKCATDHMVEKIRQDCDGRYMFEYDEYNSEYIYNADDLINLSGKKYHSKRNHINTFLRNYTATVEAYDVKYKDECLALQEVWAAEKGEEERAAEEEYVSIKKALDHYEELEYKGCVVLIDGEVVAFSIGERICKDTAVIHIEKAKRGYDGLYAYINREFVANFWSDCKYINREEDMGIPGIRQAKRSYHPVFMLDKYDVLVRK